ncbi:MAG: EamA family transporter [Clostridia bacterium]|nr:EamA family transporter [Clostridia bacterium]
MWGLFAMLSALCGGLNAVLSKRVAGRLDPVRLSLIRTAMVLAVALGASVWLGDWRTLGQMTWRSLLSIVSAGIATALAWLCYYRALSVGDVNRVTAMDKLSVVLTILGGGLFRGEPIGAAKIATMGLICLGAGIMAKSNEIDKNESEKADGKLSWIGWSVLSVLLVSASALLSKSGAADVGAELALVMRTAVVLVITYGVLLLKRGNAKSNKIDKRDLKTIMLTGVITGVGWIFYFRALSGAEAGAVQALDKLSLWVTMILSRVFFRRRFRANEMYGAVFIIAGILILFFNHN